MWLVVGLAAAIVALLLWAAGLSVRFSVTSQLALWASTAMLCLFYRPPDGAWQQKLVDTFEYLTLLSLIGTIGAVGSYAIAALTSGYADDLLAGADRALGFDWVGLYAFTSTNPWIAQIGGVSYGSIFTCPAILAFALGWTGRRAHARRFIFAFGATLALTLLIFALVPARAALGYYMGSNPAYMPQSGIGHVEIIESLRAGTLTLVDQASLAGLIAFPSFHAASAFLFIWAAWPIRWLRGPMLVLNLMMLAATPIEGGHYFVDVLGGAVVAASGVWVLRFVSPKAARALSPSAGERGGEPSGDLAVV